MSHPLMQASCSKLIEPDLLEKNCYSSRNSYSIFKIIILTCGISIGLKAILFNLQMSESEMMKKYKIWQQVGVFTDFY